MEDGHRVKTVLCILLLLLYPSHVSMQGGFSPRSKSEMDALQALLSLEDGQTLRFEVRRVRLDKPLIIEASNVVLLGIPQRTIVFSPGESALVIRGTNVTLHRLEFDGCYPYSALRIEGDTSRLTSTDRHGAAASMKSKRNIDEHRKNIGEIAARDLQIPVSQRELPVVRVSDCLFQNILGYRGAAIFAKQSKLTIQNSAFVGNGVSDCDTFVPLGSAVYINGGDVVIDTSDFLNNTCYDGSGGAVAFENCESVTVSNSTFAGNSFEPPTWDISWLPSDQQSVRGGGVCASNCGTVSFINSQFMYNQGIGGGGVYASNCSALLAINSSFEDNSASSNGGGIYTKECTAVNISSSRLERNSAASNGGGVYAESTVMMLVMKSHFEKNSAQVTGGALYASSNSSVIEDSGFVNNTAWMSGGGIGLQEYGSSADLCNVTLKDNSATFGGAVSLSTFTSLSHCKRPESTDTVVRFLGNTAFRGGGLYCLFCRMDLTRNFLFKNNVAAESGGGMHVEESVESHIDARFTRNIASFGGGAYLTDCSIAEFSYGAVFRGNTAIEGGGLHITSLHGRTATYRLLQINLVNNRALNTTSLREEVHNPLAMRWVMRRETVLSIGHPDWMKGREEFQGRGGGLFIMLQNSREQYRDILDVYAVSIRNNFATIGGGVYIDNGRYVATRRRRQTEEQTWSPCFLVGFEGVKIISNTALIAGGGMFARRAKDAVAAATSPPSRFHYVCDTCFDNNRVSSSGDMGYGPQGATGASSLVLQNVEGSVTGLSVGDKLAVRRNDKNTGSSDFEEITLIVKDALDQPVTGKFEDAELTVVLVSDWISGARRYKAKNGVIRINSTFVAGVNVSDVLVFQSDDERQLNVTLNFTTSPCLNGELPTESGSQCFRCPSQTYTFNATDEGCHQCESNAICSGTVSLVPKDGYWHSNPFSPFIRRCLLKEACTFLNRTANLTEYYNASDVANKLECFKNLTNEEAKNCSEGYVQCADGYEGVLCGTCAGNHGHSNGGECKFCSQSLTTAWILSLLGIIVLFLVLTGKVALGVDGVRKHVSDILQQEKRAIRSTLLHWRSGPQSPTQEETAPVGGGESVHAPSEIGQDGAGTADHFAGEGTFVNQAQTRPLLERAEENVEDPGTDTESESEGNTPISAALSAASGLLVSTYNILFNYVQLSTVALTLDVDWQSALKYFFSLNSVQGRVMRIEILPIDCAFSDRDEDVGIPNSLAVLWLRISFPFMAVAAYLTAGAATKLVRSGKKTSKYKVDFLPSLTLIFFVVYLAYCIDIVSDLLTIMHCHDLSDDISDSHPHRAFETLESRSVWVEDTSVTCWRGAHLVSAVLAAMGLCLCLAVIVSMIVILHRGSKRRQLKRAGFISSYGILFLAYRTEGLALHWESVITVRKMLLAGVEVYSSHSETSGVQIGLLAIVIFAALALQDIVQPFQEENEATFPAYAGDELRLIVPESWRQMWADFNSSVTLNGLEVASLFMSLSFFLVAGCISDEKASDREVSVLLGACFFLNAVFFFFMIYRLWYGVHQYLDALANDHNFSFTSATDRVEDRKTYLLTKIWKWLTFKPEQEEEGSAAHDAAA